MPNLPLIFSQQLQQHVDGHGDAAFGHVSQGHAECLCTCLSHRGDNLAVRKTNEESVRPAVCISTNYSLQMMKLIVRPSSGSCIHRRSEMDPLNLGVVPVYITNLLVSNLVITGY